MDANDLVPIAESQALCLQLVRHVMHYQARPLLVIIIHFLQNIEDPPKSVGIFRCTVLIKLLAKQENPNIIRILIDLLLPAILALFLSLLLCFHLLGLSFLALLGLGIENGGGL